MPTAAQVLYLCCTGTHSPLWNPASTAVSSSTPSRELHFSRGLTLQKSRMESDLGHLGRPQLPPWWAGPALGNRSCAPLPSSTACHNPCWPVLEGLGALTLPSSIQATPRAQCFRGRMLGGNRDCHDFRLRNGPPSSWAKAPGLGHSCPSGALNVPPSKGPADVEREKHQCARIPNSKANKRTILLQNSSHPLTPTGK